MRQPTLKQFRYLSSVAEQGHFGNAARACHVSQSTLSAGISELEDALGAALVERNHRQVILTTLGREVVERSRHLLVEVDDIIALCDASREPFNGRLRLGVIPTIAPFLLPAMLTRLREQYPRFQLYIREDLSARLVAALALGELDLLLLALPFPAEQVETMTLFEDPFLFAAPEGHPLAAAGAVDSGLLKGQELLLLEDGHCLRDHALEACKLRDSDISVPYQATSLTTIVQMVANGIGTTLLPAMACDAGILAGTSLAVQPFSDPGVCREVGLMWRRKTPRRHEFTLLGEFIRDSHGATRAVDVDTP